MTAPLSAVPASGTATKKKRLERLNDAFSNINFYAFTFVLEAPLVFAGGALLFNYGYGSNRDIGIGVAAVAGLALYTFVLNLLSSKLNQANLIGVAVTVALVVGAAAWEGIRSIEGVELDYVLMGAGGVMLLLFGWLIHTWGSPDKSTT